MPGPKTTLLRTLLSFLSTTPLTTALPPALPTNLGGVRLCTEPNYAGSCWYGIMPLDDCIALNSLYAKHSRSHSPGRQYKNSLTRK